MNAEELKKDLFALAEPERAEFLQRFFKTGPGEYAENDVFWGLRVPQLRKAARKYKDLELKEIADLIGDKVHEVRLTGLFILVGLYQRAKDDARRTELKDFYLANLAGVNNWDLVDSSAHKILGAWLLDQPKERRILRKLAKSRIIWERRVAMIACYTLIKAGEFDDALEIAEILVDDEHDLMHKAVGWMLREIGNKDQAMEEKFLKKYYKTMPRTMLRYAIEKFSREKRDFYLGKSSSRLASKK